jgi:hypothetical protein
MIYTCERCHIVFEHEKKPGGYRFCGQKCANQHALKLGREELVPWAELGARMGYMAKRLEVSPCTLRRALIAHGLYRLWASRRYLKCASPTVGNQSKTMDAETSTASAMVISPSSELVALMATGTSCGS